ncbi:DUF6776 family protein [Castellaniella sp.]|uniref:DUF6776 family protein n=1 Tax=Castellaniella sp. TaxID=1955812 RepID=UPI002AFF6EDB|nr:DUF6776 family protein [Castellaniella sp.]
MTRDDTQTGGLRRWMIRTLTLALGLALAFLAGAAAMHLGMHAGDQERIQGLQDQVASQRAELTQAQTDLAAAHSQVDVQSGTQRVLQEKFAELQQQLGHVRDQLAFYEQLIPPGPAGALTVRAFDIQADADFLRYRVLLTRNAAPNADPFKGRMRFVAQGHMQGKPVKMDLNPPLASDQAGGADATPGTVDPLALVFDQFQRSTGVLQVPAGLEIQSVRLEVLEGDTIRATQDAALNRAAQPAQEPQS